jgi:nitric oxide reductase activation protein
MPSLSLAVIARDSAALTPSRAQLARLLADLEALRLEAEPLQERLQRLDAASSRHDQALAHRDALLGSYEAMIAESIALGAARPEAPPALEDAEIALRQAASDERAVVNLPAASTSGSGTGRRRGARWSRSNGSMRAANGS